MEKINVLYRGFWVLAEGLVSKQVYTWLEIEISSCRKGIMKVPIQRKMLFCHWGYSSGF